MDHFLARETADKVAAAILRAGKTKAAVADATGIAQTTFGRKLNGHTEFTLGELLRIAAALQVPPYTFMPDVFRASPSAVAS